MVLRTEGPAPGRGRGRPTSAPPPCPDAHLAAIPARCLARRPGRKEQAQLAPGAQTLPARTADPPPGRMGAAHVTQGPAPGSFALTPRHPTRGRAPIGCAAARGGGTYLARCPNSPGSQAAARPWVRSQHCSSGSPDRDRDEIRGNSAVWTWGSRLSSPCLGVLICQMRIAAQFSGTAGRNTWL